MLRLMGQSAAYRVHDFLRALDGLTARAHDARQLVRGAAQHGVESLLRLGHIRQNDIGAMQNLAEVASRVLEVMSDALHVLQDRHNFVAQLPDDLAQPALARKRDELVLRQYRRRRAAGRDVDDGGADQPLLKQPRVGVLAHPFHVVAADGKCHLHARVVGERQALDLADVEPAQLDRRALGDVVSAVGDEMDRRLWREQLLLDANGGDHEHDAGNGDQHKHADLAFKMLKARVLVLHDRHVCP